MSDSSSLVRSTLRRSPVAWARACGILLRPYQVEIALAVKESVIHDLGLTFVIILPRQSGKNELQAHIFSWLLFRCASIGGRIVSVSPTFRPQTLDAMDRVRASLDACIGSRSRWKPSSGYIYKLGKARLQFFSGEARARVVGATASLLLSVDEAQDISIAKFDKDFDPMTASTHATRLFWGTAWTSNTLLERQRRIALQDQQKDGLQRLFYYTAEEICKFVPAYALTVDRAIAEHGRDHPGVRSQYFCETIDAQTSLFTPARLSLLIALPLPAGEGAGAQGSGAAFPSPNPKDLGIAQQPEGRVGLPAPNQTLSYGQVPGLFPPPQSPDPCSSSPLPSSPPPCSFLLDVAGIDESRLSLSSASASALSNPSRDSTALSIVSIDLSTNAELGHPTYHVLSRHSWVGQNHLAVFGQLKALAEVWRPQHIVIDATGVGEGLWALLDRAFPARVIPVKFTQSEKSELGWRFLSIIETGRFRDHVHTDEVHLQYVNCRSEILPGPLKTLRWGVPDGARGPDGQLIHDDYLLADALTARLDLLEWHFSSGTTTFINPPDPLFEMDRYFRRPHRDEFDHYYSRPNAL